LLKRKRKEDAPSPCDTTEASDYFKMSLRNADTLVLVPYRQFNMYRLIPFTVIVREAARAKPGELCNYFLFLPVSCGIPAWHGRGVCSMDV